MKLKNVVVLLAVGGLAACGDTGSDETGGAGTSMMEKVGEVNEDVAAVIRETSETAQTALGEAVETVKQNGSELMDEVADTSQSVADAAGERVDQALAATSDALAGTPGTETAVLETAAVAAGDADPAKLEQGKRVYTGNCMACHTAGVAGAPKIGDAAVWEARVAQGMDTLYLHALQGFKGSSGGYMPPKGGFMSLSDDEVKAAVDYMVSASQ